MRSSHILTPSPELGLPEHTVVKFVKRIHLLRPCTPGLSILQLPKEASCPDLAIACPYPARLQQATSRGDSLIGRSLEHQQRRGISLSVRRAGLGALSGCRSRASARLRRCTSLDKALSGRFNLDFCRTEVIAASAKTTSSSPCLGTGQGICLSDLADAQISQRSRRDIFWTNRRKLRISCLIWRWRAFVAIIGLGPNQSLVEVTHAR